MAWRPWRLSPTGRVSWWSARNWTTAARCLSRSKTPASASTRKTQSKLFNAFFTHQAQRHGHGAIDLPLDHREPWRQIVGLAQCRAWRDVPFFLAVAIERVGPDPTDVRRRRATRSPSSSSSRITQNSAAHSPPRVRSQGLVMIESHPAPSAGLVAATAVVDQQKVRPLMGCGK